MKTIAVILAGGTGKRLGYNVPKQFIKISGKTVIEHTIYAFEKNNNIDEIIIVVNKDYMNKVEELVNKNLYKKVSKIIIGGKERRESTYVAINSLSYIEDDFKILIHDAVRPLVDERIINDVIKALDKYKAVDVAIPSSDTLIKVNEDMIITEIPNRRNFMQGQTPQGFWYKTIKKAYDLFYKDKKLEDSTITDDCGVVKRYLPDIDIFVVKGSRYNAKLTYEEDIFLIDKLFQLKRQIVGGELKDADLSNLYGKVVVIFGASSGIGEEIYNVLIKNGIKAYGFSRRLNRIDITDPTKVREALYSVHETEGRIDFVINTAGELYKKPFANLSYEEIYNILNTNYFGSIVVAKESFDYLRRTQGMLILFSSSSYTYGRAYYGVYSSSKAAVVNLAQSLANEWDIHEIKVNVIVPERANTPMRKKIFGNEDPNTLLDPKVVALSVIRVMIKGETGTVYDVRKTT